MYRTGASVALLCLALGLASCGGGSGTAGSSDLATGSATSSAGARTAGEGDAERSDADGEDAAEASVAADGSATTGATACQERLKNFVDRMADLRQSLLAGLSYAEYVVRVKAIGDAYRAVPIDRLGADCLSGPAGAAEDAFNQYLRAANVWGECAGTAGCAAAEIEPKLQRRWRIASKTLDATVRG